MRQIVLGSMVVCALVGARVGAAADGVGMKPLTCGGTGAESLYGVECKIGYQQPGLDSTTAVFREPDARVEAVRRNLLTPSSTQSFNPSNIHTLSGVSLPAGKHVLLDDGDYYANITIVGGAAETTDPPIVVRAKNPGKVRFVNHPTTGAPSYLAVRGKNVILSDLKFIGSQAYSPFQTVVALGWLGSPCDRCMAVGLELSGLSLDWKWRPYAMRAVQPDDNQCTQDIAQEGQLYVDPPGTPPQRRQFCQPTLSYLSTYGQDITVAYSTFSHHDSPGHYLVTSYPQSESTPPKPLRLNVYRNLFRKRFFWGDANGYELLQLGYSEVQTQSMFGRVEENVFEDSVVPVQETELITVKSSDWIIRNNTFRNTMGNLTLRATNRVLVEGNFFLGGGTISSTGVRVHGAHHWIVRNYFSKNGYYENLLSPPFYATPNGTGDWYHSIVLPYGNIDEPTNVPQHVVIANNTFVDGARNIHLGKSGYTITPHHILIANNLASIVDVPDAGDPPLFVLPSGSESDFLSNHNNFIEKNFIDAGLTGLASVMGLLPTAPDRANTFDDAELVWDGWFLRFNTPTSTIHHGRPLVKFPVTRTTPFDVSAFESREPINRPLTDADTGASGAWNRTNLLTATDAVNDAAWYRNRLQSFGTCGTCSKTNVTDVADPNGVTSRVELVREDITSGTHSFEQVISATTNQTYTFSVYLRACSAPICSVPRTRALLYLQSPQVPAAGISMRANLSGTGSLASTSEGGDADLIDAEVQQLDGGWYRVSLTGVPTAMLAPNGQVRAVAYLVDDNDLSSYTGTTNAGMYAWGAQLERDFTPTVLRQNRVGSEVLLP